MREREDVSHAGPVVIMWSERCPGVVPPEVKLVRVANSRVMKGDNGCRVGQVLQLVDARAHATHVDVDQRKDLHRHCSV